MPLNTEMKSRRLRNLAINLSLAVASLILVLGVLALGELAVGKLAPQLPKEPQGLYYFDERMGAHRPLPNRRVIQSSPEIGSIELRTNSLGLRDDQEYGVKTDQSFRILALGDSFTWGQGVTFEETWLHLLELRLNDGHPRKRIELIKAGVPGYGTRDELNYLRNYGLKLQPDLVLLAFIGEDMLNNGAPWPEHFVPPAPPTFGSVLRARSPEQLEWRLRHASHLYNLLIPLASRGWMGRWFTERKAADSFVLRSYPAKWVRLWETTEGFLNDMHDSLQEAGIPLVIVVIPQRLQILVDQFKLDPLRFEPDKPYALVKNFANDRGLPVFDLLPSFRVASMKSELYFPVDGHPNASGTRVIAENVWAFLQTLPEITSLLDHAEYNEGASDWPFIGGNRVSHYQRQKTCAALNGRAEDLSVSTSRLATAESKIGGTRKTSSSQNPR